MKNKYNFKKETIKNHKILWNEILRQVDRLDHISIYELKENILIILFKKYILHNCFFMCRKT